MFARPHEAIEQAGPIAGGLAGIGVGVLAVGDEGLGLGGELGGDVAVKIEHTPDRQVGADAGPQAAEDLGLEIDAGLRDSGTVQHEADAIETAGEFAVENGGDRVPEFLDDLLGDDGTGAGPQVDGGEQFPARGVGDFQHTGEGRAIAGGGEEFALLAALELGERGGSREEGVSLVEESGQQHTMGHGWGRRERGGRRRSHSASR